MARMPERLSIDLDLGRYQPRSGSPDAYWVWFLSRLPEPVRDAVFRVCRMVFTPYASLEDDRLSDQEKRRQCLISIGQLEDEISRIRSAAGDLLPPPRPSDELRGFAEALVEEVSESGAIAVAPSEKAESEPQQGPLAQARAEAERGTSSGELGDKATAEETKEMKESVFS